MKVNTLVIGYKPAVDKTGLKPATIREEGHFQNIFSNYNLGDLHFCENESFLEKLNNINPIIVIVFNSQTAEEVKKIKSDCFVYVTETYRQIVRNKSIDKQNAMFVEMQDLIKHLEEEESNEKGVRDFCAMTYKDTYELIKKMLTSDNKEHVDKAMELLNLNHGDWPWMRANLVIDCWNNSNAKGREEYMTISMENHVKSGNAERIEDLDEDGLIIKQYKLKDGNIYKIPVAQEKMDKDFYAKLLDKYNPGSRVIEVDLKKSK